MKNFIFLTATLILLAFISCNQKKDNAEPETKKTKPTFKLVFRDSTIDYSTDESLSIFKDGDRITVQKLNDGYQYSQWELASAPITGDTIMWEPYPKTHPKSSIYAGDKYHDKIFYRKAVIKK